MRIPADLIYEVELSSGIPFGQNISVFTPEYIGLHTEGIEYSAVIQISDNTALILLPW